MIEITYCLITEKTFEKFNQLQGIIYITIKTGVMIKRTYCLITETSL